MRCMLSGHPEGMALPPVPDPQRPWIVAAAATNTACPGRGDRLAEIALRPLAEAPPRDRASDWRVPTGRHMGRGRQILPPVPMYRNFTDADLEAICSFLPRSRQ